MKFSQSELYCIRDSVTEYLKAWRKIAPEGQDDVADEMEDILIQVGDEISHNDGVLNALVYLAKSPAMPSGEGK